MYSKELGKYRKVRFTIWAPFTALGYVFSVVIFLALAGFSWDRFNKGPVDKYGLVALALGVISSAAALAYAWDALKHIGRFVRRSAIGYTIEWWYEKLEDKFIAREGLGRVDTHRTFWPAMRLRTGWWRSSEVFGAPDGIKIKALDVDRVRLTLKDTSLCLDVDTAMRWLLVMSENRLASTTLLFAELAGCYLKLRHQLREGLAPIKGHRHCVHANVAYELVRPVEPRDETVSVE